MKSKPTQRFTHISSDNHQSEKYCQIADYSVPSPLNLLRTASTDHSSLFLTANSARSALPDNNKVASTLFAIAIADFTINPIIRMAVYIRKKTTRGEDRRKGLRKNGKKRTATIYSVVWTYYGDKDH